MARKNVNIVQKPTNKKETNIKQNPSSVHQVYNVNIPEMINYLPIAWNFARMDSGGKFKCSLKELHKYSKNLVKMEKLTKSELQEKNQHNHPMPVNKISSIAKKRVKELNIEEETLYQLDLGTPVRLFGIWEHNIFHIIWLDLEHAFYECK